MTIQEVMLRIEIPEEVRENIGKYSLSEKEFYEWKHLFENNFDTLKANKAVIKGDANLKVRVEILRNRFNDFIDSLD